MFDAFVVLVGAAAQHRDVACGLMDLLCPAMPVLVVQLDPKSRGGLMVAPHGVQNIDVIHVPHPVSADDVAELLLLLKSRAIRRPLGWVAGFEGVVPLVEALRGAFWVYDAHDEIPAVPPRQGTEPDGTRLGKLLGQIDLVVAPSADGLAQLRQRAGYAGPAAVAGTKGEPEDILEQIAGARNRSNGPGAPVGRFNVGVFYDPLGSLHVATIREHLRALQRYSANDVILIPATAAFWQRAPEETAALVDLAAFDVVIVHYSLRLSVRDHLDEGLARCLERFRGLKVLFIQDEYEHTEMARAWMDRLNFALVYTCVPEAERELVYPRARYPTTDFLPTLTGFVPEDAPLERFVLPLAERTQAIAYRGRRLHPVYGSLGMEKYRIGVEMKRHALARGLAVDIEVDDEKRIYNDDWYRFLGSARATLGTESGSNVFDFTGSIRAEIALLRAREPSLSESDLQQRTAQRYEGLYHMNQISPKIFEAIRLRTALVLFEGTYSGVVQPDRHYIALAKDFANVDDVLDKVQDDAFVLRLTECAYDDIIASGRYSYRTFVTDLDRDVRQRLVRARGDALLAHLVAFGRDGQVASVLPPLSIGLAQGTHPMGRPPDAAALAGAQRPAPASVAPVTTAVGVAPRHVQSRARPVRNLVVRAAKSIVFRTSRLLYRVRTGG